MIQLRHPSRMKTSSSRKRVLRFAVRRFMSSAGSIRNDRPIASTVDNHAFVSPRSIWPNVYGFRSARRGVRLHLSAGDPVEYVGAMALLSSGSGWKPGFRTFFIKKRRPEPQSA